MSIKTTPKAKNKIRCMRVVNFLAKTGMGNSQERLTDLLADALHYADLNSLDFETCLGMARNHHAHELKNIY